MMPQETRALAQLTDALYRVELAKLHKLAAEEAALRRALAELEEKRKANAALPAPALGGMRRIGADTMWQGWVDRKRRELQSELARVLARKNRLMRGVRLAFGRNTAAETLHRNRIQQRQDTMTRKRFEQEQALFLLKALDRNQV